jgi:glycosyltransferase involved in cell wall biosynthesis
MAKQSFSSYQCREIVVNYGTSSPQGDPVVLRRRFFESHPDLAGKKLLLFLSRIHPKKGCDLLLKAFARVAASDPNLHLVLAGPDDTGWQEKLEFLARTLDIAQRVTWTGMLSGEQKWSAFHAADAFILPSHQENFGIAVAEALACGLPVLISDKINIWREILADEAGLVAPDTEDGTPQLLQRWLAMTPEQCQKMRANARCCFLTRFEIGEAAESFASALQASHA